MLFCVTTRGRDRIFNKPRDSAMVRIASRRTLLVALTKLRPLVGPMAGKFENNGICVAVGLPVIMYVGAGVFPTMIGETPAPVAPPTAVGLLPHPNPS